VVLYSLRNSDCYITESDEYGGIPTVIFELSSLQELYLNFQGITLVPAKLSTLQNLQVLSLSNCPLLESISGSVGLIPNIKGKYSIKSTVSLFGG